MDLHFIPGAVATPDEREAIAAVIEADAAPRAIYDAPRAPHLAPRTFLLPALHAVHARVGWISEGALNEICARLSVAPAEAYGVATFYHMFSLSPRPATVVHVCDDIACRANGAEELCRELESRIGPAATATADGSAMWMRSPCLGQCERGPAALFQLAGEGRSDWTLTNATAGAIVESLGRTHRSAPTNEIRPPQVVGADLRVGAEPPRADPRVGPVVSGDRLLRRVGVVDPGSLDEYRAHGGYDALRRAFSLGPENVLREVVDSKLVGRGGAAFPTGRKWEAVARAPVRPHYLVCNADESEPGTFKDRVLMEEDPFALIEAMTIAGHATGCEQAYIYIRGEYPLATHRLTSAIAQARARGLVGGDVLGAGVRFEIDLRRGAGAYICGEETALFNSIEGLRGEPRNKPPFPVQAGLFGKPTLVNNVETLVNVLDIVLDGGRPFAGVGTPGSSGTKLFCVSGCATRPGLYEVPFGVTLEQLIDLAGGVRGGRRLRAVLLGGAAGVFVTPDELAMPLTLEGARAAGATLGSGVVMLFDETIDLAAIVLRIAAFFRHESCGQCVPCRVGTVRQDEALRRLAGQRPLGSVDAETALIDDLAQVMRDASICGLGQTASTAIQTAMKKLNVFSVVAGLVLLSLVAPDRATAQSNPRYIPFGGAAKGALYVADSGPAPHVAVLITHRTSNFMSHLGCRELSRRGYMVLGMNPRSDNNEAAVRFEDNALDVKAGMEFLRKQPGITKVVLFGHSGGGPTLSFYQSVAEKGPALCQGPNKLVSCGNNLAGLPRADGLILVDAHPGISVNSLRSIDPSVLDDSRPDKIDPALDPFNPKNGYNADGPSHYSEEFKARYFKAQAARMNRLIVSALDKQKQMRAGTYSFPDDDVFLVVKGDEARLMQLDPSIHHATVKPRKLLKNDGTVSTQIVESVRVPTPDLAAGHQTFARGTRLLTIKSFLSANAIRATDSMDGIDWCSSNNSTDCALKSITIPLLVTAMGGHYFVRDSEIHFEVAASADKDFIVLEGATHGITPCTACEKTPGQYSNTVKNYFDYLKQWIDARF